MKCFIPIILLFLLCTGCEDVIDVELPTEEPRLVVDALMRVDVTASEPFYAEVKVSASNDFFGEISPVELDQISLTNTALNRSMDLLESQPNSGLYRSEASIEFMTSGELVLQIGYRGETFVARTTYVPTSPLENLEVGEGALFSGEETEVLVSFKDNPNRDDFYLFDFDYHEYLVTEDEFYQGQIFQFSYFYDEEIEPGTEVTISIMGVDEPFYNYMNQVIVQGGGDQGPFQTPAATVRGNFINSTNSNNINDIDTANFALGYFAVCQTYTESITIE